MALTISEDLYQRFLHRRLGIIRPVHHEALAAQGRLHNIE
jgi:hypothetical protein